MKTNLILPSIILFLLASCSSYKRSVKESYRYEMYIDFKNISYQGQNGSQRLYLEIDSTWGMWYTGKLIINNTDSFMIRGFEKGNDYITTYKLPQADQHGGLEIWTKGENGQIRDSLVITDRNNAQGIVKEKTVLYRRPRMICR